LDDELYYDQDWPQRYWWKASFSYIENAGIAYMFEMTVFFAFNGYYYEK
jgi:hypothetical protein